MIKKKADWGMIDDNCKGEAATAQEDGDGCGEEEEKKVTHRERDRVDSSLWWWWWWYL